MHYYIHRHDGSLAFPLLVLVPGLGVVGEGAELVRPVSVLVLVEHQHHILPAEEFTHCQSDQDWN